MTKPKLLLVSAIAPFPTDSGGATRVYQTIKNLGAQFELSVIFFQDLSVTLTPREKVFLNSHCCWWRAFPLGYHQSLAYLSWGQPYWFSQWYSSELGLLVRHLLLKEQITLIQIEFSQLLYLHSFLPPGVTTIFVAHDLTTLSFPRQHRSITNPYRRLTFYFRDRSLFGYEKKYLPRFDLVIAMSEVDAEILRQNFGVKKSLVIPNGLKEIRPLTATKTNCLKLGFIGPFAHTPNRQAVAYFIRRVAGRLEKAGLTYQYFLAGKNDPELVATWIKQARLQHPEAIINLGFVLQVADFYRRFDILLVTLTAGSGTRVKILEALGYGKIVLTTPIGAEGLDTQALQIILAATPLEFVQQLQALKRTLPPPNFKALTALTWENIFANYAQKLTVHLRPRPLSSGKRGRGAALPNN